MGSPAIPFVLGPVAQREAGSRGGTGGGPAPGGASRRWSRKCWRRSLPSSHTSGVWRRQLVGRWSVRRCCYGNWTAPLLGSGPDLVGEASLWHRSRPELAQDARAQAKFTSSAEEAGHPPGGEGEDSVSLGVLQDAGLLDHEPLLGAAASASAVAPPLEDVPEADSGEDECPICTEPYGPGEHRLELLNCGHGLCAGCLHQLLGATRSTDLGRVRCPLCRQKTPMLEWEICRLQEELLQADGPQPPPPATPPVLPRRGPGPWAALEHRYQLRFLAGPMGVQGCLPFLPCPPCLGAWLWALRERGPCARRLALLSLLSLELLGLLLIFMPLMLLGLLVVFLDRAGR